MVEAVEREVRAFFETYCAAFERLDADVVADHFACPSLIASDADEVGLIVLGTREQCRVAVEKVIELHRQLGSPSGHIRDLVVAVLSPRLAQATLKMEVQNASARPLYEFEASYALAKSDGRWRIAAVAHNQMPRLLDCVRARRDR